MKEYTKGDFIWGSGNANVDVEVPDLGIGDGLGGILFAILWWIAASIVFVLLLIFLEVILWLSVFIILAMLYWVFFRALRTVFSYAKQTKGNGLLSAQYALGYTLLYVGWIFGIIYLADVL
jgi:hypothetical protein